MKKEYIFIRGLRKVDFSVFCVDNEQKTYFEKLTNTKNAYSSGQQVKRCIMERVLDNLGVENAKLNFNYEIDGEKLTQKEITQPCDPTYPDQLLGGWMSTPSRGSSEDSNSYKRTSPLSISPMTPLHPYLAGVISEKSITFDGSDRDDNIVVRKKIGQQKFEELTPDEIKQFLKDNNEKISKRKAVVIPDGNGTPRANGLYSFDVVIDLAKLFNIPLKDNDREISDEMEEKLRANGWVEEMSAVGKVLTLPKEYHEEYAEAIAEALFSWRITSNQSRTLDVMPILTVGISSRADELPNSIMGHVVDEDKGKAKLVVEKGYPNTVIYSMPILNSVLSDAETSKTALQDAINDVKDRILNYYK